MKLKSKITVIAIIILSLPISSISFLLFMKGDIEFETLSKGDNGHETKTFYVINTEDEFLNLWNITHTSSNPPKAPSIDFTKADVIAVYGGEYNSGASIEIVKITNSYKNIHVYYKIELNAATVISHPYHIVKTTNLAKEVVFTEI